MTIKELLDILDKLAPFSLQESYDNSGIQFADLEAPIIKILMALDLTLEILEEAIENKANLILTHHPLLFAPLKQITKQNNPLLFKTITNQINLLALHTNYDLAENGLNDYVANLLGITKITPLKSSLEKIYKFAVYAPIQESDRISQAIFEAGAGKIGQYTEASFQIKGEGTFKPMEGATPFVGKIGKREVVEEIKIETVVPERNLESVILAMKKAHPYEEPAYDTYELKIKQSYGIGIWGEIAKEVDLTEFSLSVKNKLKASYIRLIKSNRNRKIKKVALCCGGGSSLLEQVGKIDTDLYITGDINYHSALRAKELGLNILEIEHYDTEKFFVEALYNQLIKFKIPPDILMKSKKMKSPYQIL
jgi:dinuclear metal center YbgI/SA1388 family protein